MFNKDKIHEKTDNIFNNAEGMTEQTKKSGKDWLDYVMEHPLQSLLFGSVIGLAIRGLFKR